MKERAAIPPPIPEQQPQEKKETPEERAYVEALEETLREVVLPSRGKRLKDPISEAIDLIALSYGAHSLGMFKRDLLQSRYAGEWQKIVDDFYEAEVQRLAAAWEEMHEGEQVTNRDLEGFLSFIGKRVKDEGIDESWWIDHGYELFKQKFEKRFTAYADREALLRVLPESEVQRVMELKEEKDPLVLLEGLEKIGHLIHGFELPARTNEILHRLAAEKLEEVTSWPSVAVATYAECRTIEDQIHAFEDSLKKETNEDDSKKLLTLYGFWKHNRDVRDRLCALNPKEMRKRILQTARAFRLVSWDDVVVEIKMKRELDTLRSRLASSNPLSLKKVSDAVTFMVDAWENDDAVKLTVNKSQEKKMEDRALALEIEIGEHRAREARKVAFEKRVNSKGKKEKPEDRKIQDLYFMIPRMQTVAEVAALAERCVAELPDEPDIRQEMGERLRHHLEGMLKRVMDHLEKDQRSMEVYRLTVTQNFFGSENSRYQVQGHLITDQDIGWNMEPTIIAAARAEDEWNKQKAFVSSLGESVVRMKKTFEALGSSLDESFENLFGRITVLTQPEIAPTDASSASVSETLQKIMNEEGTIALKKYAEMFDATLPLSANIKKVKRALWEAGQGNADGGSLLKKLGAHIFLDRIKSLPLVLLDLEARKQRGGNNQLYVSPEQMKDDAHNRDKLYRQHAQFFSGKKENAKANFLEVMRLCDAEQEGIKAWEEFEKQVMVLDVAASWRQPPAVSTRRENFAPSPFN